MSKPLEDWKLLQKKIFTRWVNQKLASRRFPRINDVLDDLGSGYTISNLITALSEKEMTKPKNPPKLIVRAQKLEHVMKQLQFCWDSGVEMKLKPSPENIFDGDFIDVMGLCYAMMLKFLRFDDDDGESTGSAKDSLLRWCKFNTSGAEGVEVTNLTKSWHNGLALCALVSKFNPEAIDFKSLSAADSSKNIQSGMDAAEKFFKVEAFLTPAELVKLDDKSMLVFLSEYYYGINEWFKMQLAGKRITKLTIFTQENDDARKKYAADGAAMVDRLQKSEELLSGVDVIHNTMAGAKKNLSDYNTYKSTEKRQIIALHLEMMGNFSQLQVRLANNKRPAFQPETDISPATLEARIKKLQAQESVEPKLYIELNRQIKLGETDTQHTTRSAKIAQWTERKLAYLNESLEVNSSAAAVKLLNQYDAFTKELASTKSSNFVELQKTGEYLAAEKYEHIDAVKERETNLATGFEGLSVKGNENKPILDDNFKREVFREDIMQKVDVHADIDSKLKAWVKEKHMLLDVPEKVDSVMDALVHLSSLDGLDKEVEDTSSGNLARLTELGTAIRAAEYSEISQWKYEDPDAVSGKETAMNADFDDLKAKSVEKRKVLEDGLAREKLKDQVGLWVLNHTNLFANFDRWAKDKTVYLAVLEEISNSQEAMSHLNVLDAFVTDKTAFENGTIAELLALGEKIRKTEYSSEYCQWCYEKPDEITAIETNATDILGVLVSGEKEKRNVLDDDLARELYAEETRLMAGRHVDKGLQCANWASLKVEYTESDIFVHSISEAQVGLSLLDSYEVEKKRFTATAVASLKELGQTVLARKYDTKYSNYVYENPDEIKTREADIDDYWAKLDQLSALRRTSLDMLLAREEKKEKMRIDFAGHAGDLMRYMEDKIEMIGSAEEQKIIFGFNLQEIESYDATLHTIDEDVGLTVSAKRNVCAGVVAEMKLLVNQTDEFDKAQAAKDEDPEEADEVSTDNTAVEFKRTRFNTLSKGIKKAFTRNKKKTSARDLFADQKAGDGDNDEPWPEEINPFTSITVHSIAEEADELFEATEMRRSNYDATLALWRENDAMCKTFSELVDPINTDVKSMVNDLIGAPGSDEEQLARVTVTLDTLIKHCFNIPAAQKQDGAIMARGISVNPYTTLSAEDMKCELENVQVIAEQKKPYLESLIEYKRFKGISREQYEEMETLFKEYDTDSSDSISGKELRACLFSLGEERTKTEIAGYVQQHGTNDTLKFSQFRDLMVTLIGDVGTQTGLTESFLLISRGVDFVEEKDLLELCKKPQVDYFKGEAATKETGFDFAPWISAVFSR